MNQPFVDTSFLAVGSVNDALGSGAAALGGILGSALGGAPGGAGGAMMAGFGAATGAAPVGGGCPVVTPDAGGSASGCEAFFVDNAFNENRLDTLISQVKQQAVAAVCNINLNKRAEALSKCFGDEFTQLKDAINQVGKDFDQGLKFADSGVHSIDACVTKQQQRSTLLGAKADALTKARDRALEALGSLNGSSGDAKSTNANTLGGLRLLIQNHESRAKKFTITQKAARDNQTHACVAGSGAQDSQIRNCPNANGDLLSPRDCILAINHDSVCLQLTGGQPCRRGSIEEKKASLAVKRFQQRLDQMLGDMDGSNPRIPDPAQWVSRYKSELASFGPAGNQMVEELQRCDTEVQKHISDQLQDPTSELGGEAKGLNDEAETVSSEMGARIHGPNGLDAVMRDVSAQFFGRELDGLVNPAGCNQAVTTDNNGNVGFQPVALRQQLKCIEGLSANLTAILDGTPPPGSQNPLVQNQVIPGYDGPPISCTSLRSCADLVGKAKATADNNVTSLQSDGPFDPTQMACPPMQGGVCSGNTCMGRKQFVSTTNKNVQAAFNNASDMLQRRTGIIKMEFQRMQAILGPKFSYPSQKTTTIDIESVCKTDSQDLCKMPPDFGDKLATSAGLPDLGPDQMAKLHDDAAAKEDKANADLNTIKQKLVSMQDLRTTCQAKAKEKSLEKKIAGLEGQFSDKLAACESQKGGGGIAPEFFEADFKSLRQDVINACAESTDTRCTQLRSKVTLGYMTCNQVVQDNFQKTLDIQSQRCATKAGIEGALGSPEYKAAYNACMSNSSGALRGAN
jgi:hypothetical protein